MIFEESADILAYFLDSIWREFLFLVFKNKLIGNRVKIGLNFHKLEFLLLELVVELVLLELNVLLAFPLCVVGLEFKELLGKLISLVLDYILILVLKSHKGHNMIGLFVKGEILLIS
jgi:hypothetical protein